MSEGLGARLRAQRERRGIPLAAIAASTKVNAALFEALERDDVSRWPQGIFRRSFVRAYAKAIGLDPEETLGDFLEQFPDPLGASAPSDDQAPGVERPRRPRTDLRLTLAEMPDSRSTSRSAVGVGKRCAAVIVDGTVVLGGALALFAALGSFWIPLAIVSLCYYTGATLVLGNTPAARFLTSGASRPDTEVGAYDIGSDLRVRPDPYFDGIGAIASVSDPLSSS
jgi:hypothetical protein